MSADNPVVVIGAGAAGIAAARALHDAGRPVLLIEAAARIGGRAHTMHPGGFALDAGCGWLHSARRNPWVRLAEQYDLEVDRQPPNWGEQWRDLGFPAAEQQESDAAWARFAERTAALRHDADRPLADAVEDPRWRPLFDAMSGYINGAPLARVSLHDYLAYDDAASDDNWSLREGYGMLVARHAAGLNVRLGCVAQVVRHDAATLQVETNAGTIAASAVVVAVPTTVLAREALRFSPALPAKHAAASALPLGLADKVFLRVSGTLEWPENAHLLGDPHRSCTASHRLSPFGQPVIESFFGGDCAEGLANDGPGAAIDFAIEELVRLLGSDCRPRLTPLAATSWRQVRHINGAYSHAAVGAVAQRGVLAAPVDQRIFFVGEACHPSDFSTAHGAYATGAAAADAVLACAAGQPR